MTRRILLLILLFVGYQSLKAQDVSECSYMLEDAKEAYAAGMVELIPSLLLPCLGPEGLTGDSRGEAFKLVINAYIFDHLPEDADSLMSRFLDENPDYRAGDTDPAEFVQLLNNNLISRGIDPYVVEATALEGDTSDDRSRRGKRERVLGVSGNSLGFEAGVNANVPQVVERYSMGDPGVDDGHFHIIPGFQVAATINFALNRRLDISTGLIFNYNRFKYSARPLTFTSYEYIEEKNQLQIPVSLICKLNPKSQRFRVYLRGGVAGDYLITASGSGTRRNEQSGSEISVSSTDLSGGRQSINLTLMAGLGFRYLLNRSFIYAETRFATNVFLSNLAAERYQNNDLNWLLYHVDSDLLIQQVMICAGMCWNISNREDR